MARPHKERRVCSMPNNREFCCLSKLDEPCSRIILNVEEYEAVRLIDYLGMTQEQCASHMGVARGTVQSLYNMARTKISRFLIEGTRLEISGGSYELCSSNACRKSKVNYNGEIVLIKEESSSMKIAVTYDQGQVFQHFGHTEQFKLYETNNGKIISSEVVDTNGSGHGELAEFLKKRDVDVLICGGIGGGAKNALSEAGIRLYAGAAGDADAQVESFLAGSLSYNPNTECNHHEHHNGEKCSHHDGKCKGC